MLQRKLGIYPYRYGNRLTLIESGHLFFDKLVDLIESAKEEIHFQLYIFEPDATGRIIADLLIKAAARGVKIYVVLDAYGSKNFNETGQKEFRKAGIAFYFYSPIKFGNYLHMGMRLHHKIICVDKQYALVGGINVSNNYSQYTDEAPWLDFAVFIEGSVIIDLLQICYSVLRTVRKEEKHFWRKIKVVEKVTESEPIKARVLQNNWLQAKFGISRQYKQKIRAAEKQITLVVSYFIPPISLKRILKKASKRGVQVNLILGAVSDVGLVKHASQYFYADMLKSGIKLFEWNKSVLHGKLALVDSDWMCIGSYNLNHLSDFGSIECNIEVFDDAFCQQSQSAIDEIIAKGCSKIELSQFNPGFMKWRFWYNALCYFAVRLLLGTMFFLQHRHLKKNKYKSMV
ncbi:MAG: phospholipase D-like domain-containing protein [Bacteroidota bacterium]